jgi:hypothetical protein
MPSSGMLRRVALVRTDVSEELSAPIIRVTRIGDLGTMLSVTKNRRTLLVTSNVVPSLPVLVKKLFLRSVRRLIVTANVVSNSQILVTLMMDALTSSETSVLSRATRRNTPEDGILNTHCRGNLKSYIALTGWDL